MIHGERVAGDVLEAHEDVVEQNDPTKRGDVGVGHQRDRGGGGDHQGLREDQPRPAAAEPCEASGVDDGAPGPLEAPGKHGHGDDAADLGCGRPAGGEVGREGNRDEAVGDPLPRVEQAQKRQTKQRVVGERDHGSDGDRTASSWPQLGNRLSDRWRLATADGRTNHR